MSNPYRQTLVEVVRGVDRTLFEDYVKPKVTHFITLIRKGVLESSVDWFETPRPTEVRQYIHEILISLVAIHAQVSATSRALLERTLAALIVEIVNEALLCFRQISRFGMGGMLRVCPISASQIVVSLIILSRRPWRLSLCTKPSFNMSTNRQVIPSRKYIPPSQRRINVVLVPMETYKRNLMVSNEHSTKRGELPRSSIYASRHLERRKTTTLLEALQKHHRRHNTVFVVCVLLFYSIQNVVVQQSLCTRQLCLNGSVDELLRCLWLFPTRRTGLPLRKIYSF